MSVGMIRDLEAVLDQENPDMFKWLTGQVGSPGHGVSARLQGRISRCQAAAPLAGRPLACGGPGGRRKQGLEAPAQLHPSLAPPAGTLPARAAAQLGVCGAAGACSGADRQAPPGAAGSGAGTKGVGARLDRHRKRSERRQT
jgi:hypothetical protein